MENKPSKQEEELQCFSASFLGKLGVETGVNPQYNAWVTVNQGYPWRLKFLIKEILLLTRVREVGIWSFLRLANEDADRVDKEG